jgi:hypothetical protein
MAHQRLVDEPDLGKPRRVCDRLSGDRVIGLERRWR